MTTTDDIKSRIDIVSYIQRHVPTLKRAGKNYKACCPFHDDNTPSFIVSPHKQSWRCYGACDDGGDIFSFYQKLNNADFKDALKVLAQDAGIKLSPYEPRQSTSTPNEIPELDYYRTQSTESDKDVWQERAHKFIGYAEDMMWSDDTTGLTYLRERGFTDKTIMQYRLGYCPQNFSDDWGLENKVWLPQGIVIPYETGEYARISKIRVRRLEWAKGDKYPKYISPAGVQNTALLTRKIRPNDIVVLTEGELDAFILKQVITDPYVVAMATGSTGAGRYLQYLALLSLAKKVLVAFDADEAGETASQYWMNALTNATRKPPTQKDINDMYLAGDDIHQWVYGE